MSKEDQKYAVKLDFAGTQATWHVLMNTEVKGRSDSRNHSRLIKLLKAGCMKPNSERENDFDFKGGSVELDGDKFKYLKEVIQKKLDVGIAGSLSEAYCSLLDALDDAKEATDNDAEKLEKKSK